MNRVVNQKLSMQEVVGLSNLIQKLSSSIHVKVEFGPRDPIIKDLEYMTPKLENFFAVRISGNNLELL